MSTFPLVALLPMKAHSSRVPRKNFRHFAGRPLFDWILQTLLSVEEIDRIVINTDARALLAENGLQESPRVVIRDRKAELCGDEVSMVRVLADDLAHVAADLYLMTHTTNPLLGADTIRGALRAFREAQAAGTADSLFAVNTFRTRFYRADGSPINHDPQRLIPTQQLEPWFEENSNLYLFTAQSFTAMSHRIGRRPLLYSTPRIESIDIDDQADWDLAELVALSLAASPSAAEIAARKGIGHVVGDSP